MQRIIAARFACVAWLLLIVHSNAAAQSGTGAISGTVQDSSKSVLPGATITLVSPGTIGGNQTAVSDDRGAYQFIRLVPGTYSVKGELAGFGTVLHERIVVNADVTARADFTLAVGELEETITVTGMSPLVDTSQALNQTALDNTLWQCCRRETISGRLGAPCPASSSTSMKSEAPRPTRTHERGFMGLGVTRGCCR